MITRSRSRAANCDHRSLGKRARRERRGGDHCPPRNTRQDGVSCRFRKASRHATSYTRATANVQAEDSHRERPVTGEDNRETGTSRVVNSNPARPTRKRAINSNNTINKFSIEASRRHRLLRNDSVLALFLSLFLLLIRWFLFLTFFVFHGFLPAPRCSLDGLMPLD